jgi:calnexin
VATEYRETTWKPKFDVEKEKEAAEVKLDDTEKASAVDGIKGKVFEVLHKIAELPFLAKYKSQIDELLAKGEENATVTLSILATIPILLLTLFYSLIFGKKKKSAPVVSRPQSPFIYKILLGVQCCLLDRCVTQALMGDLCI